MLSKFRQTITRLLRSRRARSDFLILATGLVSAILAAAFIAAYAGQLEAALLQFAQSDKSQPSSLTKPPSGFVTLVSGFVIQNALVPTVLLSLSILLILAFAVSSIIKSLKSRRVRVSLNEEKSLPGIFRLAFAIGVTCLSLGVAPGTIAASALDEARLVFSDVEKAQSKVASDAEARSSEALADSLSAHTDRMEHLTSKGQAQMDCRASSNARTYYSGNSYVEADYYNSCALLDYLKRTDFTTEERVGRADARLSLEGRAAQAETATLSAFRENLNSISTSANMARVSQLILLLLAGFALLSTFAAAAGQFLSKRAVSTSTGRSTFPLKTLSRRSKCPKCAEYVKYEAVICKHCGSEIQKPANGASEM